MLNRALTSGTMFAVASAAVFFGAAHRANAGDKVPVKFAVNTVIGPSDAPVRTAEYSDADRSQVQFQTVGWRGRGYYSTYYAFPAYYPAYGYYPAPTYTYYYPAAPVYVVPRRRAFYAPAPMYVPYGTNYYYGW
ncbi:MAG: hypothetical protein IT427_20830 [Pirellulales bacterium]|nr:hypothetical protein [Pirellulales bacterium]